MDNANNVRTVFQNEVIVPNKVGTAIDGNKVDVPVGSNPVVVPNSERESKLGTLVPEDT